MENQTSNNKNEDPRKEPGDELAPDDGLTAEGYVKVEDSDNETDDLDLVYNEEEDSYELDLPSEDPEYQHDDPYDTSAPGGSDDNSEWDEDNPLLGDEYDKDKSLETDLDGLGMHIDTGKSSHLSKLDEKLAETPEDDRDDLDEEGYPKRDPD